MCEFEGYEFWIITLPLGMFGVGVGGLKVVEYHTAICLGIIGVGGGGFKGLEYHTAIFSNDWCVSLKG